MDQKLLRILGGDTHYYPHALESKYPRVFATLMTLWDEPEGEAYLNKLLVSERSDREGFPPEVATEIVHLSLVHAGQHQKNVKQDVWEPEARIFANFDPLAAPKDALAWPAIPSATTLALNQLGIHATSEGFFRAAATGNMAAMRLFLEAGVPLETRNEEGWTCLMSAAYNGKEELANLLLAKSADALSIDTGGNTALHWAAFAGRLECCKLLAKYGAEIDARSNFGWTPLYQTVARGHLIVTAFLIAQGADINASAKDGLTPLHKAAATGAAHMIRLLLSHGADPYLTNQLGETALDLAIKNNHDEAEAMLRNAG
ncbi:MAG: ankyrin repeat domain-containing protein [Gallionella sp.]